MFFLPYFKPKKPKNLSRSITRRNWTSNSRASKRMLLPAFIHKIFLKRVWFNDSNKILTKKFEPIDYEEELDFQLQGRQKNVTPGIHLQNLLKRVWFNDSNKIWFRALQSSTKPSFTQSLNWNWSRVGSKRMSLLAFNKPSQFTNYLRMYRALSRFIWPECHGNI